MSDTLIALVAIAMSLVAMVVEWRREARVGERLARLEEWSAQLDKELGR